MSTVMFLNKIGKKISNNDINAILNDDILFDSKKIWVTLNIDSVKGKGFYISNAKRLSRGRLIISKKEIVAIVGGYKIVDIPNSLNYIKYLSFQKNNPRRFEICINLESGSTGFRGSIVISYHIPPHLVPL